MRGTIRPVPCVWMDGRVQGTRWHSMMGKKLIKGDGYSINFK